MSWSDVFPILSDEMVDQFEAEATKAERAELDDWFRVKAVHGARPDATHVVSTSLFWKNIRTDLPALKVRNRAHVMRPNKKGLLRFDPWDHYVAPLLKGAHWMAQNKPEAVFRVYLAADMESLLPDLLDAGCEVHVMATNSIAHNPGAMWRFLAFDGVAGAAGKLITLVDADRAAKPGNEMAQTVEMARMGLGWWRVPVWGELNEVGNVCYRPIVGCHFGGNQLLPTKLLMQALIWTTREGKINPMVSLPGGCKPARVHGSIWPDYGFDEWFLQTALYPRAIFDGLLSFIPAEAKSRLLPLDIEYTQWANLRSELVYFGNAGGGCCGPIDNQAAKPSQAVRERDAGYWRTSNGLGYLANHIGLTGNGMEICLGQTSIADALAEHWIGRGWTVFAKKKTAPTISAGRLAIPAGAKKSAKLGGKITQKPLGTWTSVAAGSQDIVWIPSGDRFEGMLRTLEAAWDKVAEDGILGGGEMKDAFEGATNGAHRWLCTKQAVQHRLISQTLPPTKLSQGKPTGSKTLQNRSPKIRCRT